MYPYEAGVKVGHRVHDSIWVEVYQYALGSDLEASWAFDDLDLCGGNTIAMNSAFDPTHFVKGPSVQQSRTFFGRHCQS